MLGGRCGKIAYLFRTSGEDDNEHNEGIAYDDVVDRVHDRMWRIMCM